nr:unnamed protein product [Digitaria exilis]
MLTGGSAGHALQAVVGRRHMRPPPILPLQHSQRPLGSPLQHPWPCAWHPRRCHRSKASATCRCSTDSTPIGPSLQHPCLARATPCRCRSVAAAKDHPNP